MKKKKKTRTSKSSALSKKINKTLQNGKSPVYFFLSPENNLWIKKTALQLDQPFSYVVDHMLECYRRDRPITFEKKIPSAIRRVEAARKKRVERVQEILARKKYSGQASRKSL